VATGKKFPYWSKFWKGGWEGLKAAKSEIIDVNVVFKAKEYI